MFNMEKCYRNKIIINIISSRSADCVLLLQFMSNSFKSGHIYAYEFFKPLSTFDLYTTYMFCSPAVCVSKTVTRSEL